MKKIFTILFGSALLATTNVNAQAVTQGNVIIDGYYGFFSISNSWIRDVTSSNSSTFKSIGPVGGRFEYMVSDKIGIGLEGNYHDRQVNWTGTITDTITNTSKDYSYTVGRKTIRVMPRINIHFGGSDNFDGYFGVAAGYRSAGWYTVTNDPNYGNYGSGITLIPVAIRLALGGRYFFTDNIGLNMEIGLGGGTMFHTGLTFKI